MENIKLSNAAKLPILIILAIVATLSLGFYMDEEVNINLHLDQQIEEVVSKASTVEEFLEEQEITLDKEGYINVSMEKELDEDMHIIIKRPKTYTIVLGDAEWEVTSTYNTVEEVLTDTGVNFVEENGDYAIPDIKSAIPNGHKISVFRVHEVEEVEKEKIPFEKISRKNSKLEIGKTKVIQEGREGIKEIKTRSKFVNGELVEEEVLGEEVTLTHMNRVVENGTKPKPKATRSGTPSRSTSTKGTTRTMSATGYSTHEKGLSRYTANGTDLYNNPRVVAVDPRVIPLGTVLEVEGYGRYVAADTGGAIKGNRIDIHFPTVSQCTNFGRKNVKVTILK